MSGAARRHQRTESQAVVELENVFKSVDLEGDGKLDMASFQTAMFSLDGTFDDEKMEDLFNSVDTAKQGYIRYDDFLRLLKKGKLNKTAQEVIESAKSAAPVYTLPSTVKVVGPMGKSMMNSTLGGPRKKMDAKKKSSIQRAVIVIKKAAMKNIAREEVVDFLKEKGMKDDDINYAYEKAQEQAMSKDERIRYLKAQISTKDKELRDQKAFTRHLSDEVQKKSSQINVLRAACVTAANQLLEAEKSEEEGKSAPPDDVLDEVSDQISKLRQNVQNLNKKSAELIQRDLKQMEKLESCLKTGRSFCSYLLLISLDPVVQNTMRKTQIFLSEWVQ